MKALHASDNHHFNHLQLQEQQFRLLSLQGPGRPSFCPLPGPERNNTILNPYSKTGYTCFGNEGDSNNNTAKQIIGYENSGFIEADCSNVNGKWESFNCSDAETFIGTKRKRVTWRCWHHGGVQKAPRLKKTSENIGGKRSKIGMNSINEPLSPKGLKTNSPVVAFRVL